MFGKGISVARACTGTVPAGPCELGKDCQAPNKTRQARHECMVCGRGLHALFCGSGEADVDFSCIPGFGCKTKDSSTMRKCLLEDFEDSKPAAIDLTHQGSPVSNVTEPTLACVQGGSIAIVKPPPRKKRSATLTEFGFFNKTQKEIRRFDPNHDKHRLAVELAAAGETREPPTDTLERISSLKAERNLLKKEEPKNWRQQALSLQHEIDSLSQWVKTHQSEFNTVLNTFQESKLAMEHHDRLNEFHLSLAWEPLFVSAKKVLQKHHQVG